MSLLRLVLWTFRGRVGLILSILSGFAILLVISGIVRFGGLFGGLFGIPIVTSSSASTILWSSFRKGLIRWPVSFLICINRRRVIEPSEATLVRR